MIISEREKMILRAMKKAAAPDPEIVRLQNERDVLRHQNCVKNIAIFFLPFSYIKSSQKRKILFSPLKGHTGDLRQFGFRVG